MTETAFEVLHSAQLGPQQHPLVGRLLERLILAVAGLQQQRVVRREIREGWQRRVAGQCTMYQRR
jgi:hypothetical protein